MTPRKKKTERPVEERTGPVWDHIRHQEEALSQIRDSLAAGRLPHAILLWGPPGVGKMRAAQGLTQALLCTSTAPPCGECRTCMKVARFIHPDVHVLRPLKAREEEGEDPILALYAVDGLASLEIPPPATVGIDRIRRIKEESSKTLVEGRCRVLIIPQADLMTQEAANAALKIMEEPTGETFLILTTTDLRLLLPTVVSRCRRVRFRALPGEFLEGLLVARTGADPETARLAAVLSEGSLPRAMEFAKEDLVSLRDEVLDLVAPAGGDIPELLRRAEKWGRRWDAGSARFLSSLLGFWQQDLLRMRSGGGDSGIVHRDRMDRLQKEAADIDVGEIRRRLELLEELVESVDRYVNPQLALRAFLMAWESGEATDPTYRPAS